jgi:hypothetical protein
MRNGGPRLETAIVGLLVVILNVGVFYHGSKHPRVRLTQDSGDYLMAAQNLILHGTYYSGRWQSNLNPSLLSRRPPGYPTLIAFLRLFSDRIFLIILAQLLMVGFAAFLLWQLGALLWPNWKSAPMAIVILYLFYPAQLIYTHLVMAEIPMQLCLILALYGLVQFADKQLLRHLVLFNAAIACAVLIKPVLVYFWIPNLCFLFWLSRRTHSHHPWLVGLIPLLTIFLWSSRNAAMTGYFHFSSIKITAMALMGHSKDPAAQKPLPTDFAEQSRQIQWRYLQRRLSDPMRTLRKYTRGIFGFFLDPGRYDLYQFLGWSHSIRGPDLLRETPLLQLPRRILEAFPLWLVLLLAGIAAINLTLTVSFFHFILCAKADLAVRVFMGLLIVYLVAVVGNLGVSRYRLPVEPYFIVTFPSLVLLALQSWKRCLRGRKKRLSL